MQIPQSDILTTNRLGKIFGNTVATYKFFWFLSIMQIHTKTNDLKIDVSDILIRMVANAWYPVHYFRLSFGKLDSLFDIVMELHRITQIPIDASTDTVINGLKERLDDRKIRSKLNVLSLNVPYRFLRPWIDTSDDRDMVRRSQTYENGCLYSLHKEAGEFYIELNPAWDAYLHSHYNILVDFAYWNLTLFLQVRNPNVPAIPNKLIRPEVRNSLTKQHNYWDMVMNIGGPIHCIYTGKELHPQDYDLDHFIPWSFVSHDLLWNLTPSDGSINSSKSNKLPELDKLPRKEGEKCPFCRLSRKVEIICETATCVAFYDGYPVSPGHALIIPKRHVASYFDLTNHEREAMNVVLQYVKQKVDERFHPDGYNVGINVGEHAGQSVFHCHMHLIPRYKGDVPNPKGGVRGVIPSKQKY